MEYHRINQKASKALVLLLQLILILDKLIFLINEISNRSQLIQFQKHMQHTINLYLTHNIILNLRLNNRLKLREIDHLASKNKMKYIYSKHSRKMSVVGKDAS